jgi:hypothetical protein
MRTTAIALIAGLAITTPALAQSQSGGSGLGGIIRNLDQQLNPPSDRDRQVDRDRSADRDRGTSGSSNDTRDRADSRDRYGSIRSDDDFRREKRRLDDMQAQINDAQRQLDREYGDLDRARRNLR